MASAEELKERIRARIAKINQGPRSVLFSDIEWVMNHLRDDLGYPVTISGNNKHYTYVVADLKPFQVCDHHRGQKELKVCYVKNFLNRMTELELL
jgi:hypothetical protein